MKHICMYIQDTMADWEHGYLLHGVSLQGATPTPVCTMSFAADARDAVTTAGGMRIIPDETLAETDAEGIDAFVLIGGDTWLSEDRHAALDLAEAVLAGEESSRQYAAPPSASPVGVCSTTADTRAMHQNSSLRSPRTGAMTCTRERPPPRTETSSPRARPAPSCGPS